MKPLSRTGVLVTRPENQATAIVAAIEAAGGQAICFPVIEIAVLPDAEIVSLEKNLPDPDIVIFVSSNAVIHGGRFLAGRNARYAAVGPATKKEIELSGHTVEIFPDDGFDSEHLLRTAALRDVAGKTIRIVRGVGGRELLADTLRKRGARVDYLEVYERKARDFSAHELENLRQHWLSDEVHCAIAMSVDSLEFMLAALPHECRRTLEKVMLVTPSERVIQTALEIAPGMAAVLAAGPGTEYMLEALIEGRQKQAGAAG